MTCTNELELTYTTDDDGVWLECGVCGWKKNLGFDGTPAAAMAAQQEHDGADFVAPPRPMMGMPGPVGATGATGPAGPAPSRDEVKALIREVLAEGSG